MNTPHPPEFLLSDDAFASPVKHRHVLFLSGFDPKGASYYHGLYRAEAARQGLVTGVQYQVGDRQRLVSGNTQWRVEARSAGAQAGIEDVVVTTVEFVRWDDIVRAQWPRHAWDVVRGSVRGYAAAAACAGKFGRVYRAAPRTLIALAYPAMYWLLALVIGVGLGLGAAALARSVPAPAALTSWLVGLAMLAAVMGLALRQERRLNTSWLLRIYQFAGDWAQGRVPLLEDRIDLLAGNIVTRLGDPAIDEVLVVGFSVGSILATSAMARAQRQMAEPLPGRLALMTLGHCVPLLALIPAATSFRTELARVGGRASGWPDAGAGQPAVRWAIHWTDFSSPSDWGSFALVDPLALCLPPAARTDLAAAPHMLSPRFHTLFTPDTYAVLRRDKRALHLQYLKAGERVGAYDFFALTAGPHRLPAFHHQATP